MTELMIPNFPQAGINCAIYAEGQRKLPSVLPQCFVKRINLKCWDRLPPGT